MKILICNLITLLISVIHGYELRTSDQMRAGMIAIIDEPDVCDNNWEIVILGKKPNPSHPLGWLFIEH